MPCAPSFKNTRTNCLQVIPFSFVAKLNSQKCYNHKLTYRSIYDNMLSMHNAEEVFMKKAEKTELTVSKILEAALEEFGINGYAGGAINNICKRGINKGLIYHNFKDKDELYLVCLEKSCQKLVTMVEENSCTCDQLQYMKLRMRFFTEYPNEAHIFFEAILQPQEKLRDRIQQILQPFEEINEKIYRSVVSSITLRDGITEEDAIAYFRQMQRMFNGYFSSSAYRYIALDDQIMEHEMNLPELLDFMLYGIAKQRAQK